MPHKRTIIEYFWSNREMLKFTLRFADRRTYRKTDRRILVKQSPPPPPPPPRLVRELLAWKGRKHGGKGRRKCWFPAFSAFPTMFSKSSLSGLLKLRIVWYRVNGCITDSAAAVLILSGYSSRILRILLCKEKNALHLTGAVHNR